MNPIKAVGRCVACGSSSLEFRPILWPALVEEWGLSPEEHAYVDRQQGYTCKSCGCNLRAMALAAMILGTFGHRGSLRRFARSPRGRLLRVLEVNGAGGLTQFWPRVSRHQLRCYPEFDMMAMDAADGSFDLVIHSDTLEHVPDPVRGLAECRRVLARGGSCCYTIPMVVGRLTRSREGLPHSYHGQQAANLEDYIVRTEYGADAWRDCMRAGFDEVSILSLEHPAAHAIAGRKWRRRSD